MIKAKTITATEFKAKCLEILDHLAPEGIIITKRGRPVARVLPEQAVQNQRFIGCMRNRIEIVGDIYETGVVWNAQS